MGFKERGRSRRGCWRNTPILRSALFHFFAVFLAIVLFSCAPKPEVKPVTPARVAIVLGAGASRGFAHVGVLKVLEANSVPIHMIVGTSAGSFVGSLYAYGLPAYDLQRVALTVEKGDIVDLAIPDNGFIKGERLEGFVNQAVKSTPIERLKIPFHAVTADVQTGEEVVISSGDTGSAVRASCSIPGVFRPVRSGGKMFVDGGIVSPVAVDAARRLGADIVIAVDISSDLSGAQPGGTVETLLQSISIMYSKLSAIQLARADVVIRPKVGRISSTDFNRRHEAILEGEQAASSAMPAIKEILDKLRQAGRL